VSRNSRHFDQTGIAIGQAQVQHPMGAMLGGAKNQQQTAAIGPTREMRRD